MNSSGRKTLVTIFILAILGYAIVTFLFANNQIDSAILFALGIVVGGLVALTINKTTIAQPDNSNTIPTKTLYVGNLPYRANEQAVRELFEEKGQVFSVRLLKDKNTGKRRGFGFVEMSESDANKAIKELNEMEFQQRTLKVREAKQKQEESEPNSLA
ncbi:MULTISPECIES: RNA recognition motif domain-containing protein [Pseudoalteromonas]|uniref:RNA-binding protein n=1 Tax=Pseudoalteromonas obscura TaxID=3048491 RepID=A0ABT7EPT3_9GAMM|nr:MULTISPECIES: RNA-binding protein [Pseudoalteromonas]MBQ4839571.1 RNA-binding protein [Pseudoalteromonas luteoviolacea]MDK2596990.1 RNA-binding protein [Pseudoalteromonas sp. P94(2023)]